MQQEKPAKKKGGCLKNIIIAIIVLVVLGAIFGENDEAKPVDTPPAQTQTQTDLAPEAPAEKAKEKEPDMTMGQKNALNQAKNYLSLSAFSRSGLIQQLEYEGYSTEDATFAVDNCGADWNEQAAKKAAEYLDLTSFSRSGLVDQLEYEGFTAEQAEYGASAAYK